VPQIRVDREDTCRHIGSSRFLDEDLRRISHYPRRPAVDKSSGFFKLAVLASVFERHWLRLPKRLQKLVALLQRSCDAISIMPEPLDGTKMYLDYLDKEMTIMGILSTFCVAAAALVVDRVSSASPNTFFAALASVHLVEAFTGAAMIMSAALCFYLQRSLLAYFYGSICFSLIEGQKTEWDTNQWLDEASSWAVWLRYRVGLMFLAISSIVFVHVIYETANPKAAPHFWLEWTVIVAAIAGISTHNALLSTYRDEEDPYAQFSFRTFLKDWRIRGTR
jgi:hypothetical protein